MLYLLKIEKNADMDLCIWYNEKGLAGEIETKGMRNMDKYTVLPPCMPLPTAMLRLPVSSTAKVMYARLLDATLTGGAEDTNGILFVRFPIVELAAALSRSSVTVKRSLKELEDAGLILRVRRGVGEPNRIYTLLPKKEGCRDE